ARGARVPTAGGPWTSGSPCTPCRRAPPSADEPEGHLERLVDQGAKERWVQPEMLVGDAQLMHVRHRGKAGVRQGVEMVRQRLVHTADRHRAAGPAPPLAVELTIAVRKIPPGRAIKEEGPNLAKPPNLAK